MSSVPALPGVITTYWLNSFSPPSALSICAFALAIVRALLQLVAHAAVGVHPADDEADARHAALDAVVAELLRVLLHPFVELGEALRRLLHDVGVVGERDLAVEHRQHVAVDVRAERVLRRVARHELAGADVVAVRHQQLLVDHRRGAALMHDRDVDVPGRGARLLLRRQLLVDLLRARVARPGAHRAHLHPRVHLLELRAEVVVDVVDHVLVAGADDVQCLRDAPGPASAARRRAAAANSMRIFMGLLPVLRLTKVRRAGTAAARRAEWTTATGAPSAMRSGAWPHTSAPSVRTR